jgi:hypothetical protein
MAWNSSSEISADKSVSSTRISFCTFRYILLVRMAMSSISCRGGGPALDILNIFSYNLYSFGWFLP